MAVTDQSATETGYWPLTFECTHHSRDLTHSSGGSPPQPGAHNSLESMQKPSRVFDSQKSSFLAVSFSILKHKTGNKWFISKCLNTALLGENWFLTCSIWSFHGEKSLTMTDSKLPLHITECQVEMSCARSAILSHSWQALAECWAEASLALCFSYLGYYKTDLGGNENQNSSPQDGLDYGLQRLCSSSCGLWCFQTFRWA